MSSKLKTIRVLGIDPSLRNLGLCIADLNIESKQIEGTPELRLIETQKTKSKSIRTSSDDLSRSQILFDGLQDALSSVDFVFCEMPTGSQSSSAMKSYGVVIGLMSSIKKPLIQISPNEVKELTTKNKTATKKEMIDWAVNLHPDANWLRRSKKKSDSPLLAKNEHLADAIASIYAGTLSNDFQMLSKALTLLK